MVKAPETFEDKVDETERIIREYKQVISQIIEKETVKLREVTRQEPNHIITKANEGSTAIATRARHKAEQIVSQANKEAEKIITEAKRQAEQMVNDAEKGVKKEAKKKTQKEAERIIRETKDEMTKIVAVARQAAEIASSYSNLEFNLQSGHRGSRTDVIRNILIESTGAEDALVVNNNAAAVYLALRVLAAGREVVVSRGELVEIGGSFRIPDVMAASGARLVEVGTTNKTRTEDYRRALGPDTALLLKVHRSNFEMIGFTEEPSLVEL